MGGAMAYFALVLRATRLHTVGVLLSRNASHICGIAGSFTSIQSTIFDKLGSLTWGSLLAALGLVKLV
jgi:hypothetical protein